MRRKAIEKIHFALRASDVKHDNNNVHILISAKLSII